MDEAIKGIQHRLEQHLGDELGALYLYGSYGQPTFQPGHSDVNLLAVVGDEVNLHFLRHALLPVWQQHATRLRRPPVVASRTALIRHLQLFPLFAWHLRQNGTVLAGSESLPLPIAVPPPVARVSYLAQETLLGSAALAPDLLEPAQARLAYRRLHRIVRQITEKALAERPPAAHLFAQAQLHLRALISELRGDENMLVIDDPNTPNLEGIYEETDRMVVLLPPLSRRLLAALDWQAIAERLAAQHNMLHSTTADQLLLVLQREAPVDFVLGRYRHVWGRDPLDGLAVTMRAVLHAAARLPSTLLVTGVGGEYVTAADDEAIHTIVHDYQNRLLNLRLQHELLHRMHGLEAANPPDPLPARDTPPPARVDAIVDHLEWWAAHYAGQIDSVPATQRITPP